MRPLLILTAAASGVVTHLTAQGPLAPSGPPAPIMKSLVEIEPRRPLPSDAIIEIGVSGSYYLTGNVSRITINSNDVTLDLNGFTVKPSGDLEGIGVNGAAPRTGIIIRNGYVVGPGVWTQTNTGVGTYAGSTKSGIVCYAATTGNTPGQNIRIENVTVRGFSRGIDFSAGGFNQISNCIVRDFGSIGIISNNTVITNTVVHNGDGVGVRGSFLTTENLNINEVDGIGIVGINGGSHRGLCISNVSGRGISGNKFSLSDAMISFCGEDGINGNHLQLENCNVSSNTGHGIFAADSTVKNCVAINNDRAGIWADSSVISGCKVMNSGADGIRGVNSTISACKVSNSDKNTTDGYTASSIYWFGGRQVDNVSDSYSPAAPGP